eukprot:15472654-Alexandrium_andersonii.AAC.1
MARALPSLHAVRAAGWSACTRHASCPPSINAWLSCTCGNLLLARHGSGPTLAWHAALAHAPTTA